MSDAKKPIGRKHPAHHQLMEQSNCSSIVFVTVCSKDRKPLFARSDVHELVVRSWEKADLWIVGRYVLMPDHIHLFCSPAIHEYPPLKKWIQYWKALVSKKWPHPAEQPIWQQDFWDTQLRQSDTYSEKWHYVLNNPVRAGLIGQANHWPFQDEMETLYWHD